MFLGGGELLSSSKYCEGDHEYCWSTKYRDNNRLDPTAKHFQNVIQKEGFHQTHQFAAKKKEGAIIHLSNICDFIRQNKGKKEAMEETIRQLTGRSLCRHLSNAK